MIRFLILFSFLCWSNITCKAQVDFTAKEILAKSIEFCGGRDSIAKINSSSLIYDLTTGDSGHGSVVEKRIIAKQYMKSVLLPGHVPKSMHYDGTALTGINGGDKTLISDLSEKEEVKLLTYNLPQYGYVELSFVVERIDDQQFNQFDCYVVRATSKSGYTTLNYFDKSNFRLIMIIYPKGNRSLLMGYVFKNNVLFNSKIVNVVNGLEQSILTLKRIDNNIDINPLWFRVSNTMPYAPPADVKDGAFTSNDGSVLTRNGAVQTEQNGSSTFKLFLTWIDTYTYSMAYDEGFLSQKEMKTKDIILVKIVSWNQYGYVCHYYSEGVGGTQDYKKNK